MNKFNKELDNLASNVAKKYFKRYRTFYKKHASDLDDLKQEARITAWETIKKYPNIPQEELKKLIVNAVKWRMSNLLRESKADNNNLITFENHTKGTENELTDEELLGNISSKKVLPQYPNLLQEKISKLLDPGELELFEKRFFHEKTLKEIGKECNLTLTKERIHQKIGVLKSKIKDRIKNSN